MLAFSLPVPVLYYRPTVLMSFLAAVFASATALFVVSRQRMGLRQALEGSVIMGARIAAMCPPTRWNSVFLHLYHLLGQTGGKLLIVLAGHVKFVPHVV